MYMWHLWRQNYALLHAACIHVGHIRVGIMRKHEKYEETGTEVSHLATFLSPHSLATIDNKKGRSNLGNIDHVMTMFMVFSERKVVCWLGGRES